MAKGRCAINKRRRAPGNPTKFLEDPSGRRTRCMKRILGVVRKCMQLTHMIGPDLNLLLFMSTVDPLEAEKGYNCVASSSSDILGLLEQFRLWFKTEEEEKWARYFARFLPGPNPQSIPTTLHSFPHRALFHPKVIPPVLPEPVEPFSPHDEDELNDGMYDDTPPIVRVVVDEKDEKPKPVWNPAGMYDSSPSSSEDDEPSAPPPIPTPVALGRGPAFALLQAFSQWKEYQTITVK